MIDRRALWLAAVGLGVSACTPGGRKAAADAGMLRRSHSAPADTLDPHLTRGHGAANMLAVDLFEGLTTFGADGRVLPGVARSWRRSADGLTYAFALHEGLHWSDGVPLTAEDFIYSLRRVFGGEIAPPDADYLFPIVNAERVFAGELPPSDLGVRAADSQTVEIRLQRPTPFLPELLSLPVAAPAPRHVIARFGTAWTRPGRMVSNGPYVLEANEPQDYVQLRRNPHFRAADHVALARVRYLIVQDQTTALRLFQSGALDVIDADAPTSQLDWLRTHLPHALRLSPRRALQYYVINTRRPPFDNPAVRRALSLAIDRRLLVERVLRSPDRPAFTLAPPGTNGWRPPPGDLLSRPWGERQAEARRLLATAGFGPRQPLELTIRFNTERDAKKAAVAVAAMWQAVGVQARLQNSDSAVVLNDLAVGNFDVGRLSWGAEVDDPASFFQLLDPAAASNRSGYDNPAYTRLVRAAERTVDLDERSRLFAQAEVIALHDAPIIPLFFMTSRNLVAPNIAGWASSARYAHPSRFLRKVSA